MAKRTISQFMPANLSWCSWWTRTRRNPIASTRVAGGCRARRGSACAAWRQRRRGASDVGLRRGLLRHAT